MSKVKKETCSERSRTGFSLSISERLAVGLRKFGIPKCVLVDDSQSFRKKSCSNSNKPSEYYDHNAGGENICPDIERMNKSAILRKRSAASNLDTMFK